MNVRCNVIGLTEFRRALQVAADATPRELTKVMKSVGEEVVLPAAKDLAPRKDGDLGDGLYIQIRTTTGYLRGRAPYTGGAEWGRHGKWKGFTQRWGAPPRFAAKAVEQKAEQIALRLSDGLADIVSAHDWFRA